MAGAFCPPLDFPYPTLLYSTHKTKSCPNPRCVAVNARLMGKSGASCPLNCLGQDYSGAVPQL